MAADPFYHSPADATNGDPLILTALLEDHAQRRLDALRRAHYPPDRNRVPAHLTLFHKLPADWLGRVDEHLEERCWTLDPLAGRAMGLRFTGHGVVIDIDAPALVRLRAELGMAWRSVLSPQDRQRFVPHVTIQNKVTPARARRTLQGLETVFEPFACGIEGLSLWRYRGGPWEPVTSYPFGAAPSQP
jgi:2'-5' RNA ligase